tara:strand:+ start:129 stop:497 length:369 start_codon:yes stop_codon:yes gene_type:complete
MLTVDFDAPGCNIYINTILASLSGNNAGGSATVTIPVPSSALLAGAFLTAQSVCLTSSKQRQAADFERPRRDPGLLTQPLHIAAGLHIAAELHIATVFRTSNASCRSGHSKRCPDCDPSLPA